MSNENDSLYEPLDSCDHNSPECVSRLMCRLKRSEQQLASIRNDQEQLLRLQQWTDSKVNTLGSGRVKKTIKTHNLDQINDVRNSNSAARSAAIESMQIAGLTRPIQLSSSQSASSTVAKPTKSALNAATKNNMKSVRPVKNDESNETSARLRNLSNRLRQLQVYIEEDMLSDKRHRYADTYEEVDSDGEPEAVAAIAMLDSQLRTGTGKDNKNSQQTIKGQLKKVQNRSKLNQVDLSNGKHCNRSGKTNVRLQQAQQVTRQQAAAQSILDRYEADGSEEEEDAILNSNRQAAANAFVQSLAKHQSIGAGGPRDTQKLDFSDLEPQKYLKRSDQNINRLSDRPVPLFPINANGNAFVFSESQTNPLLTSQQLLNCVLQQNVTLLQQQQALLVMCQRLQCQLLGYEQNPLLNAPFASTLPTGSLFAAQTGNGVQHPINSNGMFSAPEMWSNQRLPQSPNDSMHASTPLLGNQSDSVFKSGITLNNQVAPGIRANNFVDNFRSQSRHNQLNGSHKSNQSRVTQINNSNRGACSHSDRTGESNGNGLMGNSNAGMSNSVVIEEPTVHSSPFSSIASSADRASSGKLRADSDSSKKMVNLSNRDVFAHQPTAAQITLLYEMLQKLLDEKKDVGLMKSQIGSKSESVSFDEPIVAAAVNDVIACADLNETLAKTLSVNIQKGRSKQQISPLLSLPGATNNLRKVPRNADPSMVEHQLVVGTQYTRPLMAADGQSCEAGATVPAPALGTASAAILTSSSVHSNSSPVPNGKHLQYLHRPEVTGAPRSFVARPVAELSNGADNDCRAEADDDEEEDEEEEDLDDETDEQQTHQMTESDTQTDDLNLVNVSFVDSPNPPPEVSNRRLDLQFEPQIVSSVVSSVNEIRLSGDGEQGL
jgi:hypothetical protein